MINVVRWFYVHYLQAERKIRSDFLAGTPEVKVFKLLTITAATPGIRTLDQLAATVKKA